MSTKASKAETCQHVYPRKAGGCEASADYVVDYAGGIGACRADLGSVLAWVLDDGWDARVYTRAAWAAKLDQSLD